MAFVDFREKKITCKIVYSGPERAGKTTNVRFIWERTRSAEAEFKSADTAGPTYDFLPLSLGEIRGFKTMFHLYTTPGLADCAAARFSLLRGVDGIIFVADSAKERLNESVDVLRELESQLVKQGYALDKMPRVLQCNKRDLPDALPLSDMTRALASMADNVHEAIAKNGTGVFDTLKSISRLVLTELKKG